jgi:hypothetical protein
VREPVDRVLERGREAQDLPVALMRLHRAHVHRPAIAHPLHIEADPPVRVTGGQEQPLRGHRRPGRIHRPAGGGERLRERLPAEGLGQPGPRPRLSRERVRAGFCEGQQGIEHVEGPSGSAGDSSS